MCDCGSREKHRVKLFTPSAVFISATIKSMSMNGFKYGTLPQVESCCRVVLIIWLGHLSSSVVL